MVTQQGAWLKRAAGNLHPPAWSPEQRSSDPWVFPPEWFHGEWVSRSYFVAGERRWGGLSQRPILETIGNALDARAWEEMSSTHSSFWLSFKSNTPGQTVNRQLYSLKPSFHRNMHYFYIQWLARCLKDTFKRITNALLFLSGGRGDLGFRALASQQTQPFPCLSSLQNSHTWAFLRVTPAGRMLFRRGPFGGWGSVSRAPAQWPEHADSLSWTVNVAGQPVLLGQCRREGQTELICRKIHSWGSFSKAGNRDPRAGAEACLSFAGSSRLVPFHNRSPQESRWQVPNWRVPVPGVLARPPQFGGSKLPSVTL